MASQYHKIPGPFKRGNQANNDYTITPGLWFNEALEALADTPIWYITEKIDGTNIRVIWDGNRVEFKGKTDNAQLPPKLLAHLQSTITEEILEEKFFDKPVTLYGEGFGSKIQKGGGDYFPNSAEGENGFACFDIRYGNSSWISHNDLAGICSELGILMSPRLSGKETLSDLIERTLEESLEPPVSVFGGVKPIEGYVARTDPGLTDQRGNRVIVKLKHEDFAKLKEKENAA